MPEAIAEQFGAIAARLAEIERDKAPAQAPAPAAATTAVPAGGDTDEIMAYLRAIAEAQLYPGLDGLVI